MFKSCADEARTNENHRPVSRPAAVDDKVSVMSVAHDALRPPVVQVEEVGAHFERVEIEANTFLIFTFQDFPADSSARRRTVSWFLLELRFMNHLRTRVKLIKSAVLCCNPKLLKFPHGLVICSFSSL